MTQIFISHAEEDKRVAIDLAELLGERGYAAWNYEHSSSPGLSYLLQIPTAIDEAQAFVLIISKSAFHSPHVDNEVTRAVQQRKPIIPLLHRITHEAFQQQKPDWSFAIGATVSLPLPSNLRAIIPAIVSSLERLEVNPQPVLDRPPEPRWKSLWKHLRRPLLRWPPKAVAGALALVVAVVLLFIIFLPQQQVEITKTSGLLEVNYDSGNFVYSFEVEVTNSGLRAYKIADIQASIDAAGLPAGDAGQFTATDRRCALAGSGEEVKFPYSARPSANGVRMKCAVTIEPSTEGADALQRLGVRQHLTVVFTGAGNQSYPLEFCFTPKGTWPLKTEGHGAC